MFLGEAKHANPAALSAMLLCSLLTLLLFMSTACEQPEKPVKKLSTLDAILNAGELTLITQNNLQCYYFYRDQEMGFEYDLSHGFANYLGVRLKVKVVDEWEGMIPALTNGQGHFIGASFTITEKRRKHVAFSDGYLAVQQYIIVHRRNREIKGAEDLAGRQVHVRRGTSYQERLEQLREQGLDIHIVLHKDMPTEELIRMVAEGKIEATIADSNIALLNRRYYPKAVIAGSINDTEYLGWAVHPAAKNLMGQMNAFFKKIKKDGEFTRIYEKYYKHIDVFDYLDLRSFHQRMRSRLPRYKEFIENAAKKHGFDWRLIAAQIYMESHFNPAAKSHAGASGLMQLTENTAESLGVEKIFNPLENINAGVQHFKNLYDHFNMVREPDRTYIALAAYNVGQGHLWDARRIAKKMNLDPNKWSSLAKTLPLLRFKEYNQNAKYGYCSGTEPVNYVKQIRIYYDILRRQQIKYGVTQTATPYPQKG